MTQDEFFEEKLDGRLGCRAEVVVKRNLQKHKVELHGLKAKIIVRVKDEDENVVSEKEYPANSFLLNFMRMLYTVFTAGTITTKDTQGNDVTMKMCKVEIQQEFEVEYHRISRTIYRAGYHAWAMKEDDSHGILVGTGLKTVEPDDYAMAAQVPNGVGSGKMLYLDSKVSDTYVVGNSSYIELERSFLNYSGSTITISEIGLAIRQQSPAANILIIRDQIEPTDVPNNYGADITYVIEVSV